MSTYVIVGLGNPGGAYTGTRHNAGRMAAEHFAQTIDAHAWKEHKTANATVARGVVEGAAVIVVLPDTFMNKSGSAVLPFVKSPAAAKRLIVLYDDLDLPLGVIRISFARGSGGHKGVESIARALKTNEFVRVRIGVSKAGAKGVAKKVEGEKGVIDFILGGFRAGEMETLDKTFSMTDAAIKSVITDGHTRAMNEFN